MVAGVQFTSNHVLVLGDRQLLDHETVGQLAAATGNLDPSSSYLHILVRLAQTPPPPPLSQINTHSVACMMGQRKPAATA